MLIYWFLKWIFILNLVAKLRAQNIEVHVFSQPVLINKFPASCLLFTTQHYGSGSILVNYLPDTNSLLFFCRSQTTGTNVSSSGTASSESFSEDSDDSSEVSRQLFHLCLGKNYTFSDFLLLLPKLWKWRVNASLREAVTRKFFSGLRTQPSWSNWNQDCAAFCVSCFVLQLCL